MRNPFRCGSFFNPHEYDSLTPLPATWQNLDKLHTELVEMARNWRGPMPEGRVINVDVCSKCSYVHVYLGRVHS